MELPQGLRKFLDSIGVNTTKLQWRLYQWEKRHEQSKDQSRLPQSLRWLNYPHKFCLRCNALNDRNDKRCHKCGARLPSMLGYRIFRVLGVLMPQTGTPVVFSLMTVILMMYVLMIMMQGPSGILSPTGRTMAIFGSYAPANSDPQYWWRILGCGLVHFGLLHFGFNLFCMMQVGPVIEANIGRARVLVVITVTQLASSAATYIWYLQIQGDPRASTVGASGILFGLIGFGIAYFGAMGGGAALSYRGFLIQWAIYAFIFGLVIGANNAAHAGGFIGGYLLGLVPLNVSHRARPFELIWRVAAGISAVLWLIALGFQAASIVMNWGPGGGAS